jgi:hypothetical protein
MGILDNLENAWDENFLFESNPIMPIDNIGKSTNKIHNDIKIFSAESPKKYLEPATVLLFNIEQRLRDHIAHQIELKFQDTHKDAAHEIANFIKNMSK